MAETGYRLPELLSLEPSEMRYEEALRLVYRRRNCEAYSRHPDGGWPPCCSECGCAAEAAAMVKPAADDPGNSRS